MIDLHHIHDLNLISARLHGIDLDVEQHGAALEPLIGAGTRGALSSIESELARVIVHDWPLPHDPVVRALRSAAAAMVERLRGRGPD
jgi:hypothetical protein